jgi:glutaredoxin
MQVVMYKTAHCPMCKVLEPKLRAYYPDLEVVLVDDVPNLIEELNIFTAPTVIVWKDDIEVCRVASGNIDVVTKVLKEAGI